MGYKREVFHKTFSWQHRARFGSRGKAEHSRHSTLAAPWSSPPFSSAQDDLLSLDTGKGLSTARQFWAQYFSWELPIAEQLYRIGGRRNRCRQPKDASPEHHSHNPIMSLPAGTHPTSHYKAAHYKYPVKQQFCGTRRFSALPTKAQKGFSCFISDPSDAASPSLQPAFPGR